MAIVMPDDMAERIAEFMSGKRNFPFVSRDELMCMMYLYGKTGGVNENEVDEASKLAERTVNQMNQDVVSYVNSSAGKLDSEYIRSQYIKRELQLVVEKKAIGRITGDPTIISDCFAQHVAYYRQDHFFELYGPLRNSELIANIQSFLAERMVMVCYNRKDAQDTGLSHPLIPVYVWFRDQTGANP